MRSFWILQVLLIATPAIAGESVIILQDNTVIRTREGEPRKWPQFEVETVEIKDPMRDARCFDSAIGRTNRRERYAKMERCLG